MKRTLAVALVVATFSALSFAGTLTGKVNGASGKSVVYIDTIAGKTFPDPEKHALMDQKGLLFQPHILVVQQGTTVDFLNSDNVAHNVFWPSVSGNKKAGHNMGTWPQGQKKGYKMDTPGVVPLLCNVHPEMSGYIVVSPTPYFAETDAQGNYKIADVPDGSYKVVAWHEGDKPSTQEVTVKGDTTANLTVKK